MKPTVPDHSSELLMDYLDDALAPEEKSMVEEHLGECEECAKELEEIRLIANGLRTHKNRVFCPDASDLFSFIRSGEDPPGEVAEHLEQCEACREDLSLLRASDGEELDSPRIREAFGRLLETRAEAPSAREPFFKSVLKRLSAPFGLPVAALGAAAAAILLVVLIYPGSGVESMIGLSSVQWERTPATAKPKSLIESPRVAVILAFTGFGSEMGQETIDSLYRELKPSRAMRDRIEFINPSDVRSAFTSKKIDLREQRGEIIRPARALHADRVLILTVIRDRGRLRLKGESADGISGRVLGTETGGEIDEKDLPVQLKRLMIDLLDRYGPPAADR